MMVTFDPKEELIVVHARILGASGSSAARLALDTGATYTAVNKHVLEKIGCQPMQTFVEVTTPSGDVRVPQATVRRLDALGRRRKDFVVLCHTLPPSANVDGLLGLDFFRKRRLKIDFKKGIVTLD